MTNDRGGTNPHPGAAQTAGHVRSQVSRSQPPPKTLGALACVRGFTWTSGVRTVLDADQVSAPPLGPLGEVQVIGIVQEAHTNVRKHSGAGPEEGAA